MMVVQNSMVIPNTDTTFCLTLSGEFAPTLCYKKMPRNTWKEIASYIKSKICSPLLWLPCVTDSWEKLLSELTFQVCQGLLGFSIIPTRSKLNHLLHMYYPMRFCRDEVSKFSYHCENFQGVNLISSSVSRFFFTFGFTVYFQCTKYQGCAVYFPVQCGSRCVGKEDRRVLPGILPCEGSFKSWADS